MTSSIATAGVNMHLIVQFEAYDELDDVNIPAGAFSEFVAMVTEYAMDNRPTDLLNNNA